MKYIDNFNEFDEKTTHVNEKREVKLSRSTGNEVSAMLGKNERTGREIFKTINDNVANLEKIIDEFNEKYQDNAKIKKNLLEVKIDKAKLDLSYLISLTKLKKAAFVADVIVANILNYKVLIRPIKNARIIALAYRYYLALVRHTLQNALVMIELSSDLFFTQINSNLVGRRKQMKEMMENLTSSIRNTVAESIMNDIIVDEHGRKISMKRVIGDPKKIKEITQMMKTMNSANNNYNQYERSFGFNQNIFQDFGRNVESQLKSNQDKEIQALAEKFNNIANSTIGLTKEDQASAREHVANYAASVKMSTEARAMEVCEQININMFEIIKMFSLRNIDRFSEFFEDADKIEEIEDTSNKKIQSALDKQDKAYDTLKNNANDIQFDDKQKKKILEQWKDKGIDTICSEEEFNNIVNGGRSVNEILKDNGFNQKQINNIVNGGARVQDYGKILYGDYRAYIQGKTKNEIENLGLEDDESKPDGQIMCWMRKISIEYKKIKGLNS